MLVTDRSVDENARWGPLIAAHRRQVREGHQRVQTVEEAVVETGFDAALVESFREVCRGRRPELEVAEALSELEHAERLTLLRRRFARGAPLRSLTFPTDGPVPDDSEIGQLGISVETLQRVGDNNPRAGHIFPYHERLLREGRVELESPLSGRSLSSSTTLFQLWGHEPRPGWPRPTIIFYFVDDGEPFFLFTTPWNGRWSGFFFPERDLMLSAPPEGAAAMAMFRALVTEFARETVDHLTHEGEPPLALLVGTLNHVGHTVLAEHEAYRQCVERGLFDRVKVVLRGWANFAPHTELFPEIAGVPVRDVTDVAHGYQMVVANHYLVTRPTCNFWFSPGLGERLRTAARRHVAVHPSAELATARRRWPLVWVEIRSNDRRWVNQEEQLPRLFEALAANFPNLGAILAGWSRMMEQRPSDEAMLATDAAIVERIRERTSAHIPIFDTTGVSTLEKFAWAEASHAFVSTWGTGLIFASYLTGNPGVMHTNLGYWNSEKQKRGVRLPWLSENLGQIRVIDPAHIEDEDPGQPYTIRNHYLDWRPVFDELTPLLNALPEPTAPG